MNDRCDCENCRLGRDGPERIRDLEAQCAAMRAEIERLAEEYVNPADHHRDDCPEDNGCEDCQEADRIHNAIASDAGKALLERLQRLERLELDAGRVKATPFARDIRAQALEESAAAIRALKEKG